VTVTVDGAVDFLVILPFLFAAMLDCLVVLEIGELSRDDGGRGGEGFLFGCPLVPPFEGCGAEGCHCDSGEVKEVVTAHVLFDLLDGFRLIVSQFDEDDGVTVVIGVDQLDGISPHGLLLCCGARCYCIGCPSVWPEAGVEPVLFFGDCLVAVVFEGVVRLLGVRHGQPVRGELYFSDVFVVIRVKKGPNRIAFGADQFDEDDWRNVHFVLLFSQCGTIRTGLLGVRQPSPPMSCQRSSSMSFCGRSSIIGSELLAHVWRALWHSSQLQKVPTPSRVTGCVGFFLCVGLSISLSISFETVLKWGEGRGFLPCPIGCPSARVFARRPAVVLVHLEEHCGVWPVVDVVMVLAVVVPQFVEVIPFPHCSHFGVRVKAAQFLRAVALPQTVTLAAIPFLLDTVVVVGVTPEGGAGAARPLVLDEHDLLALLGLIDPAALTGLGIAVVNECALSGVVEEDGVGAVTGQNEPVLAAFVTLVEGDDAALPDSLLDGLEHCLFLEELYTGRSSVVVLGVRQS
jgi:hypothetical protein